MYLMRLDDACEYMNVDNWNRIEILLDAYSIKPLVGVIPECKDEKYCDQYDQDELFWEQAKKWQSKGWSIALHGYQHVYCSENGGINPYVCKSEFAGLPYEEQKQKIEKGYNILINKGLNPTVFFAPSHTFDRNTLSAIKDSTDIRIISDTIANDVYFEDDFYFVPMQTSIARKVPFKISTFCYHPNTMQDADFERLESFLKKHKNEFSSFELLELNKKGKTIFDKFLKKTYFFVRKFRTIK